MPKHLMQNCKYLADPIGYGERILRVVSKLNHPCPVPIRSRFINGSNLLQFNFLTTNCKSELISISEVELVDGVIANLDLVKNMASQKGMCASYGSVKLFGTPYNAQQFSAVADEAGVTTPTNPHLPCHSMMMLVEIACGPASNPKMGLDGLCQAEVIQKWTEISLN
ncbi:unnamed protein product [Camellia sinensis]